ncbi:MAG: hypothetical protein H6733_15690, partial [Alphaproteobacteria bacterium]|nr:hypothetical protein [Alphaproteobacteria bacterium]
MIALLLSCALAAPASLPETLRARHDALVDAGTWDDAALAQAKAMPEGGIFPFVFPLLAYANLVADGTATREALRPRVDAMAADALASTQRHLGRTVATLDGLHDQGTWLGELHLALSVARWLGSTRHDKERARLDALFHEALAASAGHPLPSYPGLVWPFDTMPPVLALRVSDAVDGTHRHDAVVRA